jgi:DNA-binding NarL/FixJ family response regulator
MQLSSASESYGRVVILTDSDSQAKICRAFALGARGYLLLGCSLEDLVTGIRSVHAGGVAVTPQVARRIAESLNQQTMTTREQSVLRQIALGQSNKRIAHQFGLAEGTVKSHVKSILRKLSAGSRGEAVANARRRGILPEEIEVGG